jgi:hypothetical protein
MFSSESNGRVNLADLKRMRPAPPTRGLPVDALHHAAVNARFQALRAVALSAGLSALGGTARAHLPVATVVRVLVRGLGRSNVVFKSILEVP